ncbi:hypothetical protein BKA82DRAFT_25509 [Pisolithus tinctorius]|uniref:Uncharacterized protein n=1 Tax=Pisolithus tinctorius Marx 270 TaxID=870435 RepID=A0A0C3K719_PISTI|nr:hypothetical protein BKA82DRAFT_25509 [Pisolithus tinctorius]KIO05387.1 hypothetical protein M404DRAFT_25509 [Pisolithus tinctorius Marx 270]
MTTTTTTAIAARTTTALDSERQPCEARTAIRWKRSAMETTELERSEFWKLTIYDEQRSQFKNLRRSTNKGCEEVQQDDRKDYSSVFDSDR